MERLKKKLKGIHEKTGRKVNVVTHSMGGLLFKSLVALDPDFVAVHVSKWVAIAAPFRGEQSLNLRLCLCRLPEEWSALVARLYSVFSAHIMIPWASHSRWPPFLPVFVDVAGAPGFITDTLLTGVAFLRGWESSLFITKWSMHQLVSFSS